MITLVKNGVYMEVSTDQLASLFERSGYVRVGSANISELVEEPKAEETVREEEPKVEEAVKEEEPEPEPKAKPKRRSRKKVADSE